MYNEKIQKLFDNQKHVGEMKDADAMGQTMNSPCGDAMKIFIKVKDGKIVDAKFKTYGCIAAIVSSEALCESVIGKTLEQAKKLKGEDIIKEIGGLPQLKMHCAALCTEALQNAIKEYEEKQ
ncbi:MAG: iron-sulfur cluster assembly scaffold protein [Nanoarchaeota archaeon]|nr:iron-sulfur cluster assembly scaffold protein [Nanoarchaeota archaeon]MBU1445281.1 iron-sulfur cluster assembly scaffold protein [Nanoarchaeota archaeon]MBU2406788.1 iron-sulfur cluster assembly scaffold protein [Nanoarchaeota archaeon]MBU2420477.1 iron-sulfur cluster assembly scaffold protein [Nanoarchaeota archaeon]MBU2475098.1 iron-sulfur cluster assembly scaffold protein [Nanoarchaeota archaeon]